MSDHEDEGGQLVPIKKPDLDKQFQLRIKIGLAATTIAQALAEGHVWTLVIGLQLALDAYGLWREMND